MDRPVVGGFLSVTSDLDLAAQPTLNAGGKALRKPGTKSMSTVTGAAGFFCTHK